MHHFKTKGQTYIVSLVLKLFHGIWVNYGPTISVGTTIPYILIYREYFFSAESCLIFIKVLELIIYVTIKNSQCIQERAVVHSFLVARMVLMKTKCILLLMGHWDHYIVKNTNRPYFEQ